MCRKRLGVSVMEMKTEWDPSSTYRVVVRGELGDQFAFLFPGMRLSRGHGNTVLTGPVADNAQLARIIERTQDLGLELISAGPLIPHQDKDSSE